MSELTLFPDFNEDAFEQLSQENGFTFWRARHLMTVLGYESWASFSNAINKAITTCNTLGIDIMENFNSFQSLDESGRSEKDFKLSRFACYLVVMNGDVKKPAVAKAQAYFATLAGAVQNYLDESSKMDRLQVRKEISDRENSLSGVVHRAGIENYAYFQNAGYRGMYNKNITQLRQLRQIPSNRSPLDFMGKDELAANLFRVTQTELKIKQENIRGQGHLEATAEKVGQQVRKTMQEISGLNPEQLDAHEDIREVKKDLKLKSKEIKLIDKKRNKPKK